jgi:hypothetical protein
MTCTVVLPVGFKRYYRPGGGTTAYGSQAVLPLSRRYCRLPQTSPPRTETWGAGEVYVMIPPKIIQCGPPLDSTVSPTTQVHQNRTGRDHASLLRASRGQNSLVPMKDSLKYLTHQISPQRHCHQSSKPLRGIICSYTCREENIYR